MSFVFSGMSGQVNRHSILNVVVVRYESGRHERTRTADPYRVKVVLYQLSYVPKEGTNSRKM